MTSSEKSPRLVKLSTAWTQGLPNKEEVTKHIFNQNRTLVLIRLVQILKERLKTIESQETTQEQYGTSNWQALQAHRNGQRQELMTILDLLKFVEGA